ncbi:MAG: hypothetical protein M1431_06760 [Candidatus Thermoplasmatota archaeon]|nr:hypothetical protein [Candidatus Thermoplasmatota archaeon]
MKIGIVGYGGRFGSAAMNYLGSRGISTIGIHGREFNDRFMDEVDFAILAVPVSAALSMIQGSSQREKLIEISSVKRPFKMYAGEIISIHPLFGPLTIGNESFRDIVHVSDLSVEGSEGIVSGIFPDSVMRSMTADDHDRLMSDLLVKPYILSIIGHEMGWESHDVKTGSFLKFQSVASILDSESPDVLMDTIRLNPYSADVLQSALRALNSIIGSPKDR